jgi:SAM-dependent methyltransferase
LLTPVFFPPLVRCGRCGLVFRNLHGAREPVEARYAERYSRLAGEQRIQAARSRLYCRFLTRYRPAPGRNHLLDVGCGTGQFLALAREHGWEAMGLDIAEAAVRSARAAELPVRSGSLTTAALPESSFDVVTLWNVLDFAVDPVAELSAARRVLTPGGLLVVRVPNLSFHSAVYWLSRLVQWWRPLARLLAKQYIFHQLSFNAATLRLAMEGAGFEKIQIANGVPSYGDPYGTLPWAAGRMLQGVKRLLSGLASIIRVCSAGKLLLGSSLWAEASKEDPGTFPGGSCASRVRGSRGRRMLS